MNEEKKGRPELRSMNMEELSGFVRQQGLPAFRAKQLFRQIQKNGAADFAQMSDLPLSLRESLSAAAELCDPRIVQRWESRAGDTVKLLLEFADGERVEMALMLYRRSQARDRATVCVSCQSGCAMGCRFCATGMFSRFRDLTAGEIVRQVQLADREAVRLGFAGVSNVVYMGMGEPLANAEQVRRSIKLLCDERGMDLAQRHITVSTCGIVPQIYKMADWGLQIGLAVSLHSADDAVRRELMPAAGHYSLDELMQAVRYFRSKTGRRVTCEYALMSGVNDSEDDARKLAHLLTESDILVNIIPANPLPERGIAAAGPADAAAFCALAQRLGVAVQIRESRGRDIEAACGQLRKRGEEAAPQP